MKWSNFPRSSLSISICSSLKENFADIIMATSAGVVLLFEKRTLLASDQWNIAQYMYVCNYCEKYNTMVQDYLGNSLTCMLSLSSSNYTGTMKKAGVVFSFPKIFKYFIVFV